MKTQESKRKIAVLTGMAIVVMAVVSSVIMPIVYMPVFEAHNTGMVDFQINESLLLMGLIGWGVILLTDLIASWGLYRFYVDKNKTKSLLMGGARLLYSLMLVIAIYYLIHAYALLGNVSVSPKEVINEIIIFQSVWQFGLIIFGMHLILLSQLVCDKSWFKKVVSALLLIAGIGYLISNSLDLFVENYESLRPKVEAVFILPMVLGELILAVLLWVKGGKEKTLNITLEKPVVS